MEEAVMTFTELKRWPKIEPKKSFSHSKDKNRKLNRKCLTWWWNHQNKQRFMTFRFLGFVCSFELYSHVSCAYERQMWDKNV